MSGIYNTPWLCLGGTELGAHPQLKRLDVPSEGHDLDAPFLLGPPCLFPIGHQDPAWLSCFLARLDDSVNQGEVLWLGPFRGCVAQESQGKVIGADEQAVCASESAKTPCTTRIE